VRDRDRRARLEALYRAHAAAVHAYARRRIEDSSAAEDVVAETFLIAWRRLDRVPAADPLPWLYATARNVLANHRRGEARRSALHARMLNEPEATPAHDDDAAEAGGQVLRALAALRPGDREALMLIAWEGLSPARAAAALGCSRPALRVRLHRARRRLAAALDRERDAEPSHADPGSTRPQETPA
jgi:RNA polymerase sigma factor (sigma-70 family)